jgi:hypothetical protein
MTADSIDTVKQAFTNCLLDIFNILIMLFAICKRPRKSSESLHSMETPIPLRAAPKLCVGIVGKDDSISSLITQGGFNNIHDGFCTDSGDFCLKLNPQIGQEVDGIILLKDASKRESHYWKQTGKPLLETEEDGKTPVIEVLKNPVIRVLKKIREGEQEHVADNWVDLELGRAV